MKRYFRSYSDKKIFGVCGGLGRYTNTDPTLWRVLFVMLFFSPYPITLTYIIITLITQSIEWRD